MARLFGTDGVRGLANAELTPELALRLASAAAVVFSDISTGAGSEASGPDDSVATRRPRAVVGRDPRASGEMLEAAVCAGLAATGVDAIRVGTVPTPAVAFLTADYRADFGVMISASHNPMPDNGIKFFSAGGHKLDDEIEDRIEAAMDDDFVRPIGAAVGRVLDAPDAGDRYRRHLAQAIDERLDGLTVVVDCAHGAASQLAPLAYADAGANVITIHADPDGLNINADCGSTHMDKLQAAVLEHGADLGLAHDGDADRCLAVDSTGQIVDGDAIMAILATSLADKGRLHENVLVATVMSNLGLHIAMREAGITVRTTAVGDRYVVEELRRGGYSLGGEQSGHIVVPGSGTTGDGILTGLMIMARMAATSSRLADLAGIVTVLPQELINVRVADKHAVAESQTVKQAVVDAEAELGDSGRVLLRPSGTEQLVRVMVEAGTAEQAGAVARGLADVVAAAGA
ncbi:MULTISPECIES: phosphoglucosamine mutase [Gordonia]|uniref:Phosphoglucosamine mutase n=2 Tax=Gordonia alkanivorans TaxID=84096 RepID=F9VSJ6_9ACTN|nr:MULTISPECIES: phosphoglucosamine mutase [Gordonia]AZZ82972.1 phosphoglucosamine mutase [Gordonia alkanivorans]ETA08703.1 phosphoglucosamine mutase [Gordonia alkanivorans CGMCC 6845]MDH3005368.1 phosphoglucosamine mutase [Gordonia alkanivorans]MDH3010335.1 phosphoglucosamine mutase [Gordonia alkanivorans]MDH3014780.1 phosphoglucosamine mutase [Gordonia alkanivorans]